MDDRVPLRRRRLLAGVAGLALTGSLAGCTGDDGSSDEADGSDDTGDGDGNGDDTDDSEVPDAEDLDLREANVVDVAFEEENGGYQFDVALHHDDGEDGYANWWQVERLDGSRLGRRDLLHAHSQQPFTRSETIDVPDDVTCVVVRGHDQTHEYGGVAMLVKRDGNLVTGTGVTFIVPDYVV